MKSLATWKIQRGTTIGLVEQLLGSHTISGAFLTQAKFRAFNFLGLFIVALWCLSPLGSQASLRVVSVEQSYSRSVANLSALDTFSEYQFGGADNVGEAATVIAGPFAAALFSASLLKDRNQDLWGNIRLPSLEHLAQNDSSAWIDIVDPTNIDYPSLVGVPVVGVPKLGNTTFTLSSSYLNIECDTFNTAGKVFTNYTGLTPGGNTDHFWSADTSANYFNIAISQPFGNFSVMFNETRDPRRLVWDSDGTHAECRLYTTYVDVNISCSSNTCSPSSARRPPQLPRDSSWTVFDLGDFIDADSFLRTFTQIFPNVGPSGIQSPIVEYFTSPYNAVSFSTAGPIYSIGKEAFQLRLAQLFNVQLLLGIDPSSLTGNFNITPTIIPLPNGTNETHYDAGTPITILGIQSTEQDLLRCNRAWLGILIVASLTLFLIAAVAAVLRLITLVPDVLGTLSLAMLDNRCQTIMGNTAWTSNERVLKMKGIKVQLGDVRPDSNVGRIGLAAPTENVIVSEVQRDRYYK